MEIPSDQKWSTEILPTPGPGCDPIEGLYEEEGTLEVPLDGRARDRNGRVLGSWQGLQVHRGDGKAGSWLQYLVEVVLFRGRLHFWCVWLRDSGPVAQLLRTQRCRLQVGQRSIRMDTAHSRQNEAKQGVAELGCTFLNETLLKQNMRFWLVVKWNKYYLVFMSWNGFKMWMLRHFKVPL